MVVTLCEEPNVETQAKLPLEDPVLDELDAAEVGAGASQRGKDSPRAQ